MSSPWSVDTIKARILARLAELGMTVEDLPSSARKGLAEDGWARTGPTMHTLKAIATALRFTVHDLLGAPRAVSAPDPQALAVALRIAIGVMVPINRDCPLREEAELLAALAGTAYSMLVIAARERPDVAYSEAGEFMVSSHVRSLWEQTLSEKS